MERINYFKESDKKRTKDILLSSQLFRDAYDAVDHILISGIYELHDKGVPFIAQGDKTKDVYFILDGEVDIVINGRGVATRRAPDNVGEMALLHPTARRSATVTPKEECVLLRIPEAGFIEVADKFPRLWQNLAAEIAKRLRERGELVDKKGTMPRLFIGSSAEYLDLAYAVQEGLLHTEISVNVWSQDCFRPSDGTLVALEREAQSSDFALFLFGNEDLIMSRGEENHVPRDNVIFELGLFTGRLAAERVYFAREIGVDLKIPSDLLGITPINYRRKGSEPLTVSVQPICNKIIQMTKLHGTK